MQPYGMRRVLKVVDVETRTVCKLGHVQVVGRYEDVEGVSARRRVRSEAHNKTKYKGEETEDLSCCKLMRGCPSFNVQYR